MRLAAWAPHTAALGDLTAWPQGRTLDPLAQLLGGGPHVLLQARLMLGAINVIAVYVNVVAVYMLTVCGHEVSVHAL